MTPSAVTCTISPGPSSFSISKPSFCAAKDSNVTHMPSSRRPIITGRRPTLSRAAISVPSSFNRRMDAVPSIWFCAKRMPSVKLLFWLMSAAISAVEFTAPPVIASKCPPPKFRTRSMRAFALLTTPITQMA